MNLKFSGYRVGTAVLALVFWVFFGPSTAHADVYHGTVVDAESNEPLADAALVVVWWTKPYIGFEHPEEFHQAMETVTDSQGKFSLDVSPPINWNPLRYIRERPTIVIYKPGYRPLDGATAPSLGFPKFPDLMDALKKGATVKLPKLKSQEEARRYVDASIVYTGVPRELTPNLIRLINIQRKMAGLTSFYPELEKGKQHP